MTQQSNFQSLELGPDMQNNLQSLGYESMTPIQAMALPPILAGKDVIAQGKTGSGKTAAFGLGILNRLEAKRFCIQALVLCPTRELADQVSEEIRRLARAIPNVKVITLCGGSPVRLQAASLEKGVHIAVGTPGRVEDHLKRNTLDLQHLNLLVLDEADKMLEMGFEDSINAILKHVPESRQTLLLSATYPKKIESMALKVMQEPEMVVVESTHQSNTIEQYFYDCDGEVPRTEMLNLILLEQQPESALVFCTTRNDVREVSQYLKKAGYAVLALHGELEQRERDQTLIRFSNGSATVLVATDVAARGLDIESLDMVVNYQMARDAQVHVHRIGRTGRAGSHGVAVSFFDKYDQSRLIDIQELMGQSFKAEALPSVSVLKHAIPRAPMVTLQIDAGKKQKVRPGDILGALTGADGVDGADVGKIKIVSNRSYVAVSRSAVSAALEKLTNDKIKGRSYRVRTL